MFVLDKPFLPSQMFAGESGAHPSEAPFSYKMYISKISYKNAMISIEPRIYMLYKN